MSQTTRRLLFVRHAQRLDRYLAEAYPTVKDWTEQCITKTEYRPMNMEFPVALPRRNPSSLYLEDPPLTTSGESCAQLVGNRLAEIGFQIDEVYSSPSLRCVQTSYRIIQGYGDFYGPHDLRIKIEGGLYEFGNFAKIQKPSFLEPKFLADRGIPVDLSYQNNVSEEELAHVAWESYTEFRNRGQKCMARILGAGADIETIMIVSHAPTLVTFIRELLKKPLSEANLEHFSQSGNVMNKPAYIASVLLEQQENKEWSLAVCQPLPSFQIRAHTGFVQTWLEKQKYDSPTIR